MTSEPLDLLESDIEQDLRRTVRDLLTHTCAPDTLLLLLDGDRSTVKRLWRSVAVDLGLAGLLVPAELGGAGASAREAAPVLEELGRAAAPLPFLTSSVIATSVLVEAADRLVPSLAAGEQTAALAVPLSTAWYDELPTVRLEGGALHGDVTSVAGALDADVLLVLGEDAAGTVSLLAVDAANAAIRPVPSLDMTRQLADITLRGAPGRPVVVSPHTAVRRALLAGSALLSSEQLGTARWCLDTTVSYLRERRQFGRAVGSFQAVKHRLADLWTSVESGVAAARYAATTLASGDEDAIVAASVAQAYLGDVAVHVAEEALQLHGGVGMTWAHPVHVHLKRAKADQIALGTPGGHRDRLADLVHLPGPVR